MQAASVAQELVWSINCFFEDKEFRIQVRRGSALWFVGHEPWHSPNIGRRGLAPYFLAVVHASFRRLTHHYLGFLRRYAVVGVFTNNIYYFGFPLIYGLPFT
jgi:hypothetical protein